jgi:hypothetical protein
MVADPAVEAIESMGIDAAGADAADFLGADEGALLENLEMLADSGHRDADVIGEARDRSGCAAEAVKDDAAGRIAERVKETVNVVIGLAQIIPLAVIRSPRRHGEGICSG